MAARNLFVCSLLAASATVVNAQPGADGAPDGDLAPPSSVEVAPPAAPTTIAIPHVERHNPNATTEHWGGGIRLTGGSGIGALPGRNWGQELAANLRHDELFAELALARWKPEQTYVVDNVELGLDVWTVRAGWASMQMPLRGWGLVEAGEVAGFAGMPNVVPRMVMGDVPNGRKWLAAGAGLGVAWPMADMVRLVGAMELAVPIERDQILLDKYGMYEPDALVGRFSVGLEVGLR